MGNIAMVDPVAHVLDIAALTLLDRGENRDEPDPDRTVSLLDADDPSPEEVEGAIGTFAELSRRDRLHAISLLDEFEIEVSPTDGDLFERDGGFVSQLVVGFVAIIYYIEW
jgi:hypothetical protein